MFHVKHSGVFYGNYQLKSTKPARVCYNLGMSEQEYKPDVVSLGSLLEAKTGVSHKHGVIALFLKAAIPSEKGEKEIQFQCRLTVEQAKWLSEHLAMVAEEISVKIN